MLNKFFTHWVSSYRGIPREIWLLSLVSLINRCGGLVIAFITLYFTSKLGFSLEDAGFIMGFFGVGALIGAYAGGWLTDKLGYYPVQFWSLVANGIVLLLMMVVQSFWLMCFTVLVLSITADVFRPANSIAIAVYSNPETRTRSVSLYRMAVNLGWAIAPVLGGLLATLGWEWLFWVDGFTCISAALMLRYLLPEKKARKTEETPAPEQAQGNAPLKYSTIFSDRLFLLFLGLTMVNALIFMQLIWIVPPFFKEVHGWSEAKIGVMSALNGAIVFLVEMPLIFALEGRRGGMYYIRIGLIFYALAHLSFLLPGVALVAAIIYMIFISFGEIFVMPFSFNFAFARANGQKAGRYMALYTMAYSVTNIVAPLFGTQIASRWGYHVLWMVVAALSIVALAGIWYLDKKLKAENAGQQARPATT